MRISKLKLVLLMAMSLFGLWASGMVVFTYYTTGSYSKLPFCSSSQGPGVVVDCAKVLGSIYSRVFGIPLELFAVLYFIVNLVLVYLVAFGGDSVFRRSLTVLFGWRFIGLIIVPYLVAVELFILQAICIYCTIMHVAIVLDFIIISYFLFYKRNSLFAAVESGPDQNPQWTPANSYGPWSESNCGHNQDRSSILVQVQQDLLRPGAGLLP